MTCSELAQLIYPYLDGEFEPGEVLEVERHLSGCTACTARVREEQQLLALLKSAAPNRTAAPDHLRHRLQRGLQVEHRRSAHAHWWKLSAAAATLVLMGASAYFHYRPYARRRFIDDAALRHAKRFPLEIEQPSSQKIEAWFGGKLDHRVAVPAFPNAVPAGARLLNVQEKQAAYISYDATGTRGAARRVGLFVYDDKQRDADFDQRDNAELGTSHGYNVVSWREGDVVYQLVSDLDEDDIRKMLASERQVGAPPRALSVQPASLRQ